MTKKERIEQEIEKTLQCFDRIERIQPRPFFFTRLKARITRLGTEEISADRSTLSFRSLGSAFLSLLIILNLISAFAIFRRAEPQGDLRTRNLAAFVEEYALLQETEEDIFSFLNHSDMQQR